MSGGAKRTAFCLVAPVAAVVGAIAHPQLWLAQAVSARKLVLLTL